MMGRYFTAYAMRLKRRRLLYRALRARHKLTNLSDNTAQISPNDILGFTTLRNEITRLPYFLEYYRTKGVAHFFVVDNDSNDGSRDYLLAQPDVSVWGTDASYKQSRFGVDWLTWLQIRYGHGHWCLTVDSDEILIYPNCDTRALPDLTASLDAQRIEAFGALMLDMYPKGRLQDQSYHPGQDPFEILNWFDVDDYLGKMENRGYYQSVQGGVRGRVFFPDAASHAPHLNKIPLIKWNRRFAYVSSTHAVLPKRLNQVFDPGNSQMTGVLLHSKFLPDIIEKSQEELERGEHFTYTDRYDDYYSGLIDNPDLWEESSVRYTGWKQLVSLGIMRDTTQK